MFSFRCFATTLWRLWDNYGRCTIEKTSFELCKQQKNRVEVQGNNLHLVLFKTKENANYFPEPRLCSFAAAQFETSLLRDFIWRHSGHVDVQNNAVKCILGIWLYYYAKLVEPFSVVLYTNMARRLITWMKTKNCRTNKDCIWRHSGHVGRKNKSEKVFWEFDSIFMQNLLRHFLLFCTPTWPGVSSREWKPRIAERTKRADSRLHLTSRRPCWSKEQKRKSLLGIWLYFYAKLVEPFSIVLYTNMAVSSREWKPRIAERTKRADSRLHLTSRRPCWSKEQKR